MKTALVFSAMLMIQLVSQIQGLVVTTDGTAMTVDCEDNATSIGHGNTYNRAAGIVSLTFVRCDSTLTTIGDEAFRDAQLTSLTLPDSVITIGDLAFKNAQLTSLTLPDSVTTIGDYAFQYVQLTSLTLPDSVTTIGNKAFQYAQLTSLTLPDSVITIGDYAFQNAQLTSLRLPDSITTIGYKAFIASRLSVLYVPSNISGSLLNTTLWSHTKIVSDAQQGLEAGYVGVGIDACKDFVGNLIQEQNNGLGVQTCMTAVYEPRDDWTGVPLLCNVQINHPNSDTTTSVVQSACKDFHECPTGTSVRYDVEQCGDGGCTQADCCGIFIEPTRTSVYSEAEITQMKNTISGLMTDNNGYCEFN